MRISPRIALALLVVAAGCGSGDKVTPPAASPGSHPPLRSAAPAPGSWPTYNGGNDRAGSAAGVPAPGGLSRAWRANLDAAVYGQPVVAGTTAYAATENNTVYAFDLASGRQRWKRHLATPMRRANLPCGNIDPLGITGTPAYDARTRTLFVATESTGGRHTLVAVNAADGTVRFQRGLDVAPGRDRVAEQERGALAVAGDRVYVPFGGLDGDCGNYVGYVTGSRTDGSGGVSYYAVPTGREGGIWAPSGPAVDPAGDVYVAVGNGASFGGRYDGSDSVLRLTPRVAAVAYFAPSTWGSENAADRDLGSTGPLLLPGNRVLIAGKTGQVYLLDAGKLGGIGGEKAALPGCVSFGGMARSGSAVFLPCQNGLQRIDITGDGLHRRWSASTSITGSPVVGGGAVWTLDTHAGRLHALSQKTGHSIASTDVGSVSRFASPALAGSLVLVPTLDGVTAVRVR